MTNGEFVPEYNDISTGGISSCYAAQEKYRISQHWGR